MKNRRLFPALVLILVATIMAVTGFMLWESGNTANLRQIHVIIENSNDNRWVQFIEGMKQAAEDQEVILTIVPTGHMETLSEEEAIIERAIANGSDGVIIQLCSSIGAASMLEKLNSRTNIELVDENAYEVMSNVVGVVSPDHKAIGETIANEAALFAEKPLEKCTIGVIRGSSALSSMEQRMDGFTEALESLGGKTTWVLEQNGDAKDIKEKLAANETPDILVALDNAGLEAAGEYASSQEKDITVIGTGTSTKSIYYLDCGIVQSLVVPEDYMMGYQSVSDLADYIHRNRFLPLVRTIAHRTIHKDTLFAEENQEILFPVQR
ncbi:MAG: substrate-binding domain-containing protein [Lachnospiraceae bacterium]|nr:substrate-binding domain-containing protein [Lachnospiraceae bacterium]